MNVLRIDVGVHTLLHINLSNVDFTGIKEIERNCKRYSFFFSTFAEYWITPQRSVTPTITSRSLLTLNVLSANETIKK